jgi:hypothetical protein
MSLVNALIFSIFKLWLHVYTKCINISFYRMLKYRISYVTYDLFYLLWLQPQIYFILFEHF